MSHTRPQDLVSLAQGTILSLGGGEADQTETHRLKAQFDKEQFFQQQVLQNSSLLSRVRKENVVMFERRRDMLTIEKTHR